VSAAAIVYAKHLDPMRGFYETGLGLVVLEDVPDEFCVLSSEDWTLSLVAVPADQAGSIEISVPPLRRERTPIKLAFEVPDLDTARAGLAALGGSVDSADHEWDFRGYRHCDGADPEGNVVQLRTQLESDGSGSPQT
jgi:catechol 2,3-dioxygenase-like lactoylglutathione lyase family enzyme